MKKAFHLLSIISSLFILFNSCNSATETKNSSATAHSPGASGKKSTGTNAASQGNFKEGTDYMVYERARILDKVGFEMPVEAYSLLLPKGWAHEGEIIWNKPGQNCNGTFKWFKAKSSDGKYSFEIFPDNVYSWSSNQELMQFNTNHDQGSNCSYREPMNAEQYLRNVFVSEVLGNAQVSIVSSNEAVVAQMRQSNEKVRQEFLQYGAGQMQINQTAVNAEVRFQDASEGFVVLGVSNMEHMIPNVYDGSYTNSSTTLMTSKAVFKYPAGEKEQAKVMFSSIMGSIRTNPGWMDAVNKFWKDFRERRQVEHIGRIRIMDAQTRAIAEATIARGNERLKSMDTEYRSWEASQASHDRVHTNFIKTIREVENFRDETGKYEMVSGYNHAWSRGDGTSFVLSNNPNFNAASVFQDQNWKEMKKVDD